MPEQLQQAQPALLRLSDVSSRVGLKKSAIYERVALGRFPRPVKLDGAKSDQFSHNRWVESEVDAWIRERIAAREAA
jgi:prophage regulatory protein